MSVSVCLSVCDHIFGTTRPIFGNFWACYLWPWLDRFLLRISGFMDVVIFEHKLRLLEVTVRLMQ